MLNHNQIYEGDCLDLMKDIPDKSIDLVLTDPPYPDYMAEEYGYFDGILEPLKKYSCKQLIFWSAKAEFPLDYTAVHIWDKVRGVGSMYERIFERNGYANYRVYRCLSINSVFSAKCVSDIFNNHISQKPTQLLHKLILEHTNKGDTILDPFAGSCSIAIACLNLNRNYICIEKEPEYCEIGRKRIAEYHMQTKLDFGCAV